MIRRKDLTWGKWGDLYGVAPYGGGNGLPRIRLRHGLRAPALNVAPSQESHKKRAPFLGPQFKRGKRREIRVGDARDRPTRWNGIE